MALARHKKNVKLASTDGKHDFHGVRCHFLANGLSKLAGLLVFRGKAFGAWHSAPFEDVYAALAPAKVTWPSPLECFQRTGGPGWFEGKTLQQFTGCLPDMQGVGLPAGLLPDEGCCRRRLKWAAKESARFVECHASSGGSCMGRRSLVPGELCVYLESGNFF